MLALLFLGLDGGTYITRSDVLRGASWDLATADTSRSTRGGNASTSSTQVKEDTQARSLSGEPLRAPIVADYLGRLYNKEALLEFLLARSGAFTDDAAQHRYVNQLRASRLALEHLQTTRSVFPVKMELVAASTDVTGAPYMSGDMQPGRLYICPMTYLPCTHYPFSALATCGHILADRAIRQMLDCRCGLCANKFQPEDVIPINGTPEQVLHLRSMLQGRSVKKNKQSVRKRKDKGLPEPAELPMNEGFRANAKVQKPS